MSKRALSPALLLHAKRLHVSGNSIHLPAQSLSFDNSLYDELILGIFSHLTWIDLCATQATSKKWARLAGDNELWRNLYMAVYGRTRLRGAKGFIGRLDGREVKPLPGRAKADQYKDWKWMFRISSNWRKGRCLVEDTLNISHHSPQGESVAMSSPRVLQERTHIILAGSLTISATSQPSNEPMIIITSEKNEHHDIRIPCNDDSSHPSSITALAVDQSPPTSGFLSLACFLETGEFSIFQFKHTSPSNAVQKYTYLPSRTGVMSQTIIHAVYYHPLIATLSNRFSLSIYDLSSGQIQHTQTLSSFTSYPPASLILSSLSPMVFKLVVAYSIPVYPRHWSIGATELILSRDPSTSTSAGSTLFSSTSFREDYKYPVSSMISVISSRTIRAFDVPSGWIDDTSLRAMRKQWGRKLSSVADAQTDGKWVIIAPGEGHSFEGDVYDTHAHVSSENSPSSMFDFSSSAKLHSPTSLQLYRLILPNQSPSVSASPPKLSFVRTLHGQTSPVASLALADGRCVSLGRNGSIWVWDIEGGTGAEVAPADNMLNERTSHALLTTMGTVSFDERRIVSAHAGKVVVRRFDI